MVEDALKGVLRQALMASQDGLPGDHYFNIAFHTHHPGVVIPEYLRARYPDQMTIVIQHQFWGLEVDERQFTVTLSFNRINERLTVPFAAVTAFADPSAKFGLQFQVDPATVPDGAEAPGEAGAEPPAPTVADQPVTDAAGNDGARIITLDSFRKK
jgi:hypothetical protein